MATRFSVVIPVYKNAQNLPITIPTILSQIKTVFVEYQIEIILVNDGSPDDSYEIMKRYRDENPDVIRIASFTRNFGQSAAIYYGLSLASGDVVGVISADLQDPFELFKEMLDRWVSGAKLVCAIRRDRNETGLSVCFSKITHRLIRRFINSKYPEGGYDFYLMDASVRDMLLSIKEKNDQPQIALLWMGVPTSFIEYTRKKRDIGKSGWTMSKKIKLFIDIFTTYTYLPLRGMSVVGGICAFGSFVYGTYQFIEALFVTSTVPGWSSIVILITFFSGLILLSLGIIGEYLWRIADEIKNKPIYVVQNEDGNPEIVVLEYNKLVKSK